MHTIELLVACLAALSTVHCFLEPDITNLKEFNEEKAFSEIFDTYRQKRDAGDPKSGNDIDEGPELMEDGPPPPPPGGPGGPPGGGSGGPPPPPPKGGNGKRPPGKGPHGRKRMRCCKMPKLADKTMRDVFHNCMKEGHKERKEQKDGGKKGRGKGPGCWKPDGCLEECVFKNQTLLNSSNGVDASKLQARTELFLNESQAKTWKPLFKAAIDNCTKSLVIPADQKCKSGAFEVSKCFRRYFMMNCPTDAWSNDEKCNKIKSSIASGSFKKEPRGCNANTTNTAT